MEAFFVVVTACVLLAVGVGALVAVRRLFALTQPDPTDRRPGDE